MLLLKNLLVLPHTVSWWPEVAVHCAFHKCDVWRHTTFYPSIRHILS